MQKQVYDTCKASRYFSPFETILVIMKVRMNRYQILILNMQIWLWKHYYLKCLPDMEKATGLKLYPAYTYARIYKKGDDSKKTQR